MKIKSSELIGRALAYAVSTVENKDWDAEGHIVNISYPDDGTGWVYRPDIDWVQGGPIIDRARIRLDPDYCSMEWEATPNSGMDDAHICYGPTALTAAMRCFVASKLGDEVEVPEELLA